MGRGEINFIVLFPPFFLTFEDEMEEQIDSAQIGRKLVKCAIDIKFETWCFLISVFLILVNFVVCVVALYVHGIVFKWKFRNPILCSTNYI